MEKKSGFKNTVNDASKTKIIRDGKEVKEDKGKKQETKKTNDK